MSCTIDSLKSLVKKHDGIGDKAKLSDIIVKHFGLVKDRSVFYCDEFAIRFSRAKSTTFSNTVLSLSNLKKFDDRPFLVCLVTPAKNYLILANSTMLRKVSHSSVMLREDNIKGSFNGSDISKELDGIQNVAENICQLYEVHSAIGFQGNLPRLVEATNNISPTGSKFHITKENQAVIFDAPERSVAFLASDDYSTLESELDGKVSNFKNEILLAAMIENVNLRGRVIEYLIAGEDESLRGNLIEVLQGKAGGLPLFKTENALGDYSRIFEKYRTETDVKTKIMVLSSNPKAYNIDKILEFLAIDSSVFLFYFVGVDPGKVVAPVLVSMFQSDLLAATITLHHWAGRNSRGVTQFNGNAIGDLIRVPSNAIDVKEAKAFLERLISL